MQTHILINRKRAARQFDLSKSWQSEGTNSSCPAIPRPWPADSKRFEMEIRSGGCRTLAGFKGAGFSSVLNDLAPSDSHPGIQGHAVFSQMNKQIIIKETINQLQARDEPVPR